MIKIGIIDIGATNIKGVLIRNKNKNSKLRNKNKNFKSSNYKYFNDSKSINEILLSIKTKTPQDKNDFLLVLDQIISSFSEANKLIISYPGIIEHGIIKKSHNIPELLNTNLKKELIINTKSSINSNSFRKHCLLNDDDFFNDAVALLKASDSDAVITLGSGVGVAVRKIKCRDNFNFKFNKKCYDNLEYGHKLVRINNKQKEFEYFLGAINIKKNYGFSPRKAWYLSKKMREEFILSIIKLILRLKKEYDIKSLTLGGGVSKLPILMTLKKEFKGIISINRMNQEEFFIKLVEKTI